MILCLINNNFNNITLKAYMWGLDASGSMQGAGGVGGLLMVNAGSGGVHFPAYDLNGNVMGLVNATNGNISAKYEYGPFGEVFCSVGDMAEVNPFRVLDPIHRQRNRPRLLRLPLLFTRLGSLALPRPHRRKRRPQPLRLRQ